MTSDYDKNWYDIQVGIKDAPKKVWEQYLLAHARNMRKCARTFL